MEDLAAFPGIATVGLPGAGVLPGVVAALPGVAVALPGVAVALPGVAVGLFAVAAVGLPAVALSVSADPVELVLSFLDVIAVNEGSLYKRNYDYDDFCYVFFFNIKTFISVYLVFCIEFPWYFFPKLDVHKVKGNNLFSRHLSKGTLQDSKELSRNMREVRQFLISWRSRKKKKGINLV